MQKNLRYISLIGLIGIFLMNLSMADSNDSISIDQTKLSTLSTEHLTTKEYANALGKINTVFAQNLSTYYGKINPVKTIYKQNVVFDCITFEQQQSIIDLPVYKKKIAIHYAHEILLSMKQKLALPQNKILLENMSLNESNSCPYGYISQARPSLHDINMVPPGTLASGNTQYNWSDLLFPNGSAWLSVSMNTQPTPGTSSPTVFFAGKDINAINQNNGSFTDNQMWLTSAAGGQSVEFGWQTWGGDAPYLFAYGTNDDWKTSLPFTAAPGTPFPANQRGNYNQTLGLYYVIASKGPGDPFCGGDESGCYSLEVAISSRGKRRTGFWLVGWYSKSYYNYATFTNFQTGLELQSSGNPVNAFGAFYNAGINLVQSDEQDFNLQNFHLIPGISETWESGLLPVGIMTFSGSLSSHESN